MSASAAVRRPRPRPYELPAWRGGQHLINVDYALNQENFIDTVTRLAVPVLWIPDDEEDFIDYLIGIVAYLWKKHMNGAPSITEGRITIHNDMVVFMVVFDAPVGLRSNVERTPAQALRDLVTDLPTYYAEGSPIRKRDGDRLIHRPAGVALPALGDTVLVG